MDLEGLPEEDDFTRPIYVEKALEGEILKHEIIGWDEYRDLMYPNPKIRIPIDEEILKEMKEDGYSDEELEEARLHGMLEPLLEDSAPSLERITTTKGEWIIIAQSIDRHGDLKIVARE